MAEVGDVVRGTWASSWYPGRSFKLKDDEKKDEKGPNKRPKNRTS
jgi:hypothetical protein